MLNLLAAFVIGLIFSLGLGLAGMTQPQKVVGFLDLFGSWDPDLMWVMAGGIAAHMATLRLVLKRRKPLLAGIFRLPTKKEIDGRLITGSTLFGIGWGLAGYCPAPAMVSAITLSPNVVLFIVAMLAGMALYKGLDARTTTTAGGSPKWKFKPFSTRIPTR